MDLLLNVNPNGSLQRLICSHCVVLKNLHFNMYMYPLQRVFGLKYLSPHWLAWYGHFLDITGYYSNRITCSSKTTSSSALWTYNFNEFWQPPVFNISKNDRHDEMQPFGKLKTLLRTTLMLQVVLM